MPVTNKTYVMGIKQRLLPQLATGHMKWLFLWAHRELS
jgi:hypothetical protein